MNRLRLVIFVTLLFSSLAFADKAMVEQMAASAWSSFFSTFIPLMVVVAIISAFFSVLSKRPEWAAIGCGGIFAFAIVVAIIQAIADFVSAHKTFFIGCGIAIVILVLVFFVTVFFISKEDPRDTVYPKIYDHTKKAAQDVRQNSKNLKKPISPQIQTVDYAPVNEPVDDGIHRNVNPATYEELFEVPSARELAGKVGEDAVSRAVWVACNHDGRHYRILQNVYVPKLGGYSEIDVLLLHETGIYVFESKNVSGRIYGDLKQPRWQQYKGNGEKTFIPNPITQNENHIAALCDFLRQNKYAFRAFSLIVFGSKAELKEVPDGLQLTSIHDISSLEIELMRKFDEEKVFYDVETIEGWFKKLQPCTMLSEGEKKKHREGVGKISQTS